MVRCYYGYEQEGLALMNTIVLCATQRCGSTMIAEDMRNTGVLGNPEEWFIPWDAEKMDIDWSQTLKSLVRRATGDNGICAVKVMANQLFDVEECLKSVLRPPPGPRFFRFHKIFEDAVWVHLVRHDTVAQAVSRVMSRQTGINHATANADDDHFAGNLMRGYNPSYNADAKYDYDELLREVTAIILENLAWTNFFVNFSIAPITIRHEEVVNDESMLYLDRLSSAVRLPKPEKRHRKLVKMGNERNSEWIKRFRQDALSNSFRPKLDTRSNGEHL